MSKIIDDILAEENQELKSLLAKAEEEKKELIEGLRDLSGCNEDCTLKDNCNGNCHHFKYKQLLEKYSDKK